jgi:hypothetical protein
LADEQNGPDGYEEVDVPYNVVNSSRRHPPSFTCEPTGLMDSNVAAADLMLPHIVEAGEYPEQFNVNLKVNKTTGMVKVTVAKHGQKNTVPARLSKDRRKVTFHMGPVFLKYPQFASTSTRKLPFRQEPDGSLVIALGSAVSKRTISRATADDTAAGAQDE